MILDLHPEHLTTAELVLKMTGTEGHAEGEAIRQAICGLAGSSLLWRMGDLIEPTHAAVRAAELFAWL